MTQREAFDLLDYIELERKPGEASVRQLGNGEFVVILRWHGYHLFSFSDWRAYLRELEEKARESKHKRQQQRREAVQHAIDYSVEHRLAI